MLYSLYIKLYSIIESLRLDYKIKGDLNMSSVNYKDDDVLVLASGKMIRGWTYDTHCKFHQKEDTTIIEVLRTIYI